MQVVWKEGGWDWWSDSFSWQARIIDYGVSVNWNHSRSCWLVDNWHLLSIFHLLYPILQPQHQLFQVQMHLWLVILWKHCIWQLQRLWIWISVSWQKVPTVPLWLWSNILSNRRRRYWSRDKRRCHEYGLHITWIQHCRSISAHAFNSIKRNTRQVK